MRSGFCEILTVVFFGHSPTSRSSSGHRVIAGPICEEPFIGTRLPRSEHDDAEAANIGRLICRSAPIAAAAFDLFSDRQMQRFASIGEQALMKRVPYQRVLERKLA